MGQKINKWATISIVFPTCVIIVARVIEHCVRTKESVQLRSILLGIHEMCKDTWDQVGKIITLISLSIGLQERVKLKT